MIDYIVNDPLTNLFVPVELPPIDFSGPTFTIVGYIGNTSDKFSLEHEAACCYYTLIQSLNLVNKFLNAKVTSWAINKNIFVHPRAGKQFNAFYDRKSLKFFWNIDPVTKKEVYTSNSTDIISHEIGHAVLDMLRPDFYNVQAMEIWAFHESFGDIHSVINTLQHDIVIDRILDETNNDLRKSNIASKLAEEMGTAIYHITNGKMGHTVGLLRDMVNTFTYTEPEKLTKMGFDYQITAEPHSFSRIFSGAWYDILIGMYEYFKEILTPKEALIKARDTLSAYTYKAVTIVPNTIRFYDAMAKAILMIDKANEYKFNTLINECFIKRNILKENMKPLLALDFENLKLFTNEGDIVYNTNESKGIVNKGTTSMSLPTHMVNIDIPSDVMYEFDNNGNCVNVIVSSVDEIFNHAEECVDFLKKNDMIRHDELTPFEITPEGNLIRSHFACGCCTFNDNCKNLRNIQPEFQKCYKPENNTGCGCGGSPSTPKCVTLPTKRKGSCMGPVVAVPCSSITSSCGCNKTLDSSVTNKILINTITREQILGFIV